MRSQEDSERSIGRLHTLSPEAQEAFRDLRAVVEEYFPSRTLPRTPHGSEWDALVSRIVHYSEAHSIVGEEVAAAKPLLARFSEYPGLARVRRDPSRSDDQRKYYYFLEPNAVHIYNALLRLVIALESEPEEGMEPGA